MLIPLLILLAVELLFTLAIRDTFSRFKKVRFLKLCLFASFPLWLTLLFILYIQLFVTTNPQYMAFTLIFYALTFFTTVFVSKLFYTIIWLILRFIFLFRKSSLRLSRTRWISVITSSLIMMVLIWSVFWGRYLITVSRSDLTVNRLPKTFSGIKILQISDLHLGSYAGNPVFIQKLVDSCNALRPDIIVFTGDVVNQYADEIEHLDTVFKRLYAPMGKFAILGNHDFGDYSFWKCPKDKEKNLSDVITGLKNMGFLVIRNEHIYLHKSNDSIALVGVDNWGLKPFKQYGDLSKAIKGIDTSRFAIVLSHDPTHWSKQIKNRLSYSLTLSGHTHAFQIGIHVGNLKWSPVKYRYKNWWGNYSEKNNYLYVSRGIGTVGFMGRLGMPPEIVLITLHSGNE